MVSGVDRLPDQDSTRLIGAGLSDTTAYRIRATVYRLSVVPIRDNQADFPPVLQLHCLIDQLFEHFSFLASWLFVLCPFLC